MCYVMVAGCFNALKSGKVDEVNPIEKDVIDHGCARSEIYLYNFTHVVIEGYNQDWICQGVWVVRPPQDEWLNPHQQHVKKYNVGSSITPMPSNVLLKRQLKLRHYV